MTEAGGAAGACFFFLVRGGKTRLWIIFDIESLVRTSSNSSNCLDCYHVQILSRLRICIAVQKYLISNEALQFNFMHVVLQIENHSRVFSWE